MEAVYLDTHVVVWLYIGEIERFPAPAVARLEASALRVSPFVTLELQFLHETGRLRHSPAQLLGDLHGRIGLDIEDRSAAKLVEAASHLTWTRDPFDRLIAAQAIVDARPLLSADRRMREHLELAVWD